MMSEIKQNQIAIDGPSASGKSSIGLAVANQLQWNFLSSGKIYRSIAAVFYQMHENNHDLTLPEFIKQLTIKINRNHILVNHQKSNLIFDPKINDTLAKIALEAKIRSKVNEAIIKYANQKNVIVEGRDIATEVLPNAFLKIYIDADVHTRAQRRLQQLKKTHPEITIDEIEAQLSKRDQADQSRDIAPLKVANDAIVIDTSNLSFDDTVKQILKIFGEKHHV